MDERYIPSMLDAFLADPVGNSQRAIDWAMANQFMVGASMVAIASGFMVAGAATGMVTDRIKWRLNRRRRRQELRRAMGGLREAKAAGLAKNPKLKYSGVVLGKIGGTRLTFMDQEPVLVTGGTRSGKGVGLIRPTLLTYGGPVIAYDGGKGEAFQETSGYRSKFSHVMNLDLTDPNGVHFNPLEEVRPQFIVRDVENLIQAIPKPANSDGHFEPAADSYMGAVAMHILLAEPDSEKNMAGVLRFISTGDVGARKIILAGTHPVAVARATSLFGSSADDVASDEGMRYRQSVYNSARVRLKAFEEPYTAEVTARSDFRLADLQTPGPDGRPVTLYLSTPASDDDRVRPIVSMFLTMLIQSILANPKNTSDGRPKGKRMLLMIDEFPSLRMEILQTAITKIVGYGATMFLGAQSLSALFQEPYGIYNQFRDNIRCHVAFASSDSTTQDAISRAIGTFDRERTSVSRSQRILDWTPSRTVGSSDTQAAIMEPGAVRSLRDEDEVILMRGHPAILAQKIHDFRDPILKRRLGPKAVKPAPMRSVDGTYPDLPYPSRAHPFAGQIIAPPPPRVVAINNDPTDQTKTAEPLKAPPAPVKPKKAFKLPPRAHS